MHALNIYYCCYIIICAFRVCVCLWQHVHVVGDSYFDVRFFSIPFLSKCFYSSFFAFILISCSVSQSVGRSVCMCPVCILRKSVLPVSFIVDVWRLSCCCKYVAEFIRIQIIQLNSILHLSRGFQTKFLCRAEIVLFFFLRRNNDEIILLLIMCNNHIHAAGWNAFGFAFRNSI